MRRKIFCLLLVFAMIFSTVPVFGTNILIDESYVEFTESSGFPFIDENSRTLVPFRQTLEAFGCEVSWDNDNRIASAEKDGIKVEVPIGEKYIYKNGERIENDTAAIIKDSRTYLPIRIVLESFGYKVSWDGKNDTVVAVFLSEVLPDIYFHFIDVGQGDSVFIDAGNFEILIDAGPKKSGNVVTEYIKPYTDGNIELVIATHMHEDHIGGLPQVLRNYNVDKVIYSGETATTKIYKEFMDEVSNNGSKLIEDTNMLLTFGDLSVSIYEVLDNDKNSNNNSVATLFTYKNVKVLANGDGEEASEERLKAFVSDIDIWKAGHHGSDTANTYSLLSKIKPEVSIISCGQDNKYYHPHKKALENMMMFGDVYGTFKSGHIVITTDGDAYRVSSSDKLTINDTGTH